MRIWIKSKSLDPCFIVNTAIDRQMPGKFPPPFGGICQENRQCRLEMRAHTLEPPVFQRDQAEFQTGTNPALIG
jgi:hypothetical protein